MADQATGVADICRADQFPAQGNGSADADLLPGDRPSQGFQRRSSNRDTHAGLLRDQDAQLRLLAIPFLEDRDPSAQTQHAPDHALEAALAILSYFAIDGQ